MPVRRLRHPAFIPAAGAGHHAHTDDDSSGGPVAIFFFFFFLSRVDTTNNNPKGNVSPQKGLQSCTLLLSLPTPLAKIRAYTKAWRQTSTILTTVPVTRTSTITSCPAAAATPCSSAGHGYSSESVYTTTTVRTVLSCDGGCDAGPSRVGECVVRTRAKVERRGEL